MPIQLNNPDIYTICLTKEVHYAAYTCTYMSYIQAKLSRKSHRHINATRNINLNSNAISTRSIGIV